MKRTIYAVGCASQPTAMDATPTPRTGPLASALPMATPTTAVPSPQVVSPSPTPSPEPLGGGVAPEPPERDLVDLARRLRPDLGEPLAGATPGQSVTYDVGHTDTFFVIDLVGRSVSSVRATLKVVSEHGYWYADDAAQVPSDSLEEAAEAFEDTIYPVVTRLFGDFQGPEADQRLTVLHTPLRRLSGYYSSLDEYPSQVHPNSNQRRMLYMDSESLEAGTPLYLGVLAHELQHALHWTADQGEDAWVNEGMSEVAKEIAGYEASFVGSFLERPSTQLDYWPDQVGQSAPNYGAATLFLKFLVHHYGGDEGLRSLVREPMDGIRGVESYLAAYGKTFLDVFGDWVVANYLGAEDGQYSYGDAEVQIDEVEAMTAYGLKTDVLPQFSAGYIDLRLDGDVLAEFQGDILTAQVPTQCR